MSKAKSQAWQMLMDNPHVSTDTIQTVTGLLPEEIDYMRTRLEWLNRYETEADRGLDC